MNREDLMIKGKRGKKGGNGKRGKKVIQAQLEILEQMVQTE